ncbi:MAG: RsmD family RNA methyltransferase [Phycisphaerales bacterium]|nr:RsmD family RNA methyltransferase [Phycisphaerales bacterium]
MRIIAGRFRGRPLSAPPGMGTRPITDRVKESIFNILGSRLGTLGTLPDVRVLDLFAGAGSFGLEALSRGARFCLFVERGRQALPTLRDNIRRLGLSREEAAISTGDAWSVAYGTAASGRNSGSIADAPAGDASRFGLMFVDPPYRDVEDTLRMLKRLDQLAEGLADDGLIVFRHELMTSFPADMLERLEAVDRRDFGAMRVHWLGRKG